MEEKDIQVKSIVSEIENYKDYNKDKISGIEKMIKDIKENIINLESKIKINTKPLFKVEKTVDNKELEIFKFQNEINILKEKKSNILDENDIAKLLKMPLKKKK